MEQIMNEKKILESIDSPFVLRLFGTCQTRDDLFFITEAIEHGDLYSAIYIYKRLSHITCVFYSACIILGLEYIHNKGIVFRDLKPENIMIDSFGYPRIIDFGLAKQLPLCKSGGYEKTHTMCGTPEYLAPELIFTEGYNHLIDLWSLGVIMYEMIARRTPFVGLNNSDITQLFINITLSRKNGISLSQKIDKMTDGTTNARGIITQLLDGLPSNRLGKKKTTIGLIEHRYFSIVCADELITRTFTAPCMQPEYYGEDLTDAFANQKQYTGNQDIFEGF
uniref:Protein kinase domain-containing protein n=1 Tax=viral metagenome TaxID=1070528 RepID=A0A6C0H1A1_9ZZZZ